ncbi:MAG TPA: hypothetical protein VL563_00700 [Gemmatimonadales bacterium]|nr:hypothetical protein [Gemmatimonadales bacterium]
MRSAFTSIAIGLFTLTSSAAGQATTSAAPPSPDPRIGLRAGWMNAASAAWNLKLVGAAPKPVVFTDTTDPGDFGYMNSDLAFMGHYVIQGNFHGLQVWDIAQPDHPALVTSFICPEAQNDVSVYRNLLFVSSEDFNGRVDCGTQGVADTVSADRMRGIRILDISDILHPKPITAVQTCRGSHTHTLVTSPGDTANVYIYVSGGAPVRPASELAGCSALAPDKDPNSELFRIEVIQVPLAHPESAHVVTKPPILAGLVGPAAHGPAPEDVAEAAREADSARAQGAFIAVIQGVQQIAGPRFVARQLDSLVKARGGSGAPTAADTATLRANFQAIVDKIVNAQNPPAGPKPGPVQCHDITVYPALGLAGGACAGYGVLLDIKDPANPRRIAAAADSNFAFWHSATFNNDGTKVLFTDEWGGGLQPKCRVTDRPEWGADALFSIAHDTLKFQGYYKLPAPQTSQENCVAHNGSLIPVPGRDIMAQGWYQGGVSVFDWTDAAHPKEIAFFDRGPMDSTKLVGAGSWAAYWYNGYLISSEIGRGLDIFELQPGAWLSQNEIDAAKLVHVDYLNVQDQQKIVWPTSFVVARAYIDQLARSSGLTTARLTAVRAELARDEKLSRPARRRALTALATQLATDARRSTDAAKVRMLQDEVKRLAAQ